jgi:thioredoxin reductase (NADPH)
MYARRLNLQTIIFTGAIAGGLIITTDMVENYPGFKQISGFDLFKNVQEHAQEYDIEEIDEEVVSVDEEKDDLSSFVLKTEKKMYDARTVLFATGAMYRKLSVPGSKEFENKGVHYCALCDGFAYKNKIVAVVGGSDSAAKEALELTQHASKVYIIYRGEKIHPEPVNEKRIEKNNKIEIINNTNVVGISGSDRVASVTLDKPFNGTPELEMDGIFVAIGHIPRSTLAEKIGVQVNQKKEIIINRCAETNIAGVYSAGDVTDTCFKQMIIGCAEGVMAAYKAYEFIGQTV